MKRMMNKLFKEKTFLKKTIATAILMTMVISTYPTTNVFAWKSFGGNRHTLNGGVGNWGKNRCYYYMDTTAEKQRTPIVNAMNEWINTSSILSTPISWRETTVKTQSVLDIYRKNYFSTSSGVLAETVFFTFNNAQVNPKKKNWDWCEIHFDAGNYGKLSDKNRKGTASHEIGHVMGLAHENDKTNRIMCQLGSGRTATRASKNELKGINTLYE